MLERSAFVVLCFTLWFAPIPLGANRPWAWGLVQLLIALTTVLLIFSKSKPKFCELCRANLPIFAALIFVQLWVVLQIVGAQLGLAWLPATLDVSASMSALIKGVSFILFVLCVSVLLDTRKRQRIVLRVLMASGLTQAVYAIFLQYSGLDTSLLGYSVHDKARGSFVYHNHLASYLVLCLSASIGFLVGSLKGFESSIARVRLSSFLETLLSEKWILRVAIIIMVVGLIMTRSRMGNSAFFISVLLVSCLALVLMRRPPGTLKWLALSLVVLDVLIVGAYFGVEKVKQRIELTSLQGETRDDVVSASIPYMQDYWFGGSGAGSFGSVFQAYQPTSFGGWYDYAHNEYVQFFAELGLLSFIALAAMVLYVVANALIALAREKSAYRCGLHFACLMAVFASFLHATVDFVFQIMPNVMVLLVLMSMSLSNNKLIAKKKGKKRGVRAVNFS
ncbi:O-antigen ligase family protein [Agaribacterium haliotis]|uniref:O-antigen ligase family protein n=1 Tax=Agaribacterium haliotis TaxID=2013869 RepID=UPI000BB55E42|nr:O-antigen ligase family protein [Agaribacterium haliotis]